MRKYFIQGYKGVISEHNKLDIAKKALKKIERRCERQNQRCVAAIYKREGKNIHQLLNNVWVLIY